MVDYEYYINEYGGSEIDSPGSFNKVHIRARNSVDRYTFNRRKSVKDAELIELIKFTICSVIDVYSSHENEDGKGLRSRTIDDVSITYNDDVSEDDLHRKVQLTIRENLVSTGLMYRGL